MIILRQNNFEIILYQLGGSGCEESSDLISLLAPLCLWHHNFVDQIHLVADQNLDAILSELMMLLYLLNPLIHMPI